MTLDQAGAKLLAGRQHLVLARRAAGELVDEAAGEARGDSGELDAVVVDEG